MLLLAACRTAPAVLPTPAPTTTTTETPASIPTHTLQIPSPTIVPATLPPASPAGPIPTPTPAPLQVSVAAGVPAELAAVLSQYITQNPTQYAPAGDNSVATLRIIPAQAGIAQAGTMQPVITWIYAVAVPFATIQDETTPAEVQAAWAAGSLLMTAETESTLTAAWGAPDTRPEIVPAGELADRLWTKWVDPTADPPLALVPFPELDPRLKVLRVDGQSPVAVDFRPEGYSLALSIGFDGPAETVADLFGDWPGPLSNRDEKLITHVAMTGPAGMRRAVADRMERYGINYPGEETGPVLQAVDIAHMSNENAFASDCPLPDPFDSDNVCNRDEYLALMTWMGIDVNEMTGNHLNDWGPQALLHTFDLYETAGIGTFGGGRDLADAEEGWFVSHNGNHFAFLGCNPVGPESGWAREDYPGALPCGDYITIKEDIRWARSMGYFVIVTLQYLEDYQYAVLEEQRAVFDMLAEAGAHIVSGSHAHHPQGFAYPAGNFVHYGLGNLLADQMWSLGSRQMFIDTHLIYDGRLLNVDLWTGINEDFARVRQMTDEERAELLQAVFAESYWGSE